jgi:hypothetical protein
VIGHNIRSSTRLNAARVGLQAGNANAKEPNLGAHDLQAGNANIEEPVEGIFLVYNLHIFPLLLKLNTSWILFQLYMCKKRRKLEDLQNALIYLQGKISLN